MNTIFSILNSLPSEAILVNFKMHSNREKFSLVITYNYKGKVTTLNLQEGGHNDNN